MDFTGRIHKGTKAALGNNIPVQNGSGDQYTLPSGTGTVLVCLKPTDDIYIYKTGSGSTNVKFYLCDSTNSTRVEICTIDVTSGSPIKSGSIPSSQSAQSKDLSSLANKELYARFETVNGSGFTFVENLPISIKSPYTAVVAGNKCVTADINQTGASVTTDTKMTNSHFTTNDKIEASTFNSQVLGL